MPDGQRRSRHCLESSTIAEAFDRVYPLPKQEKEQKKTEEQQKQSSEQEKGKDSEPVPETLGSTGPSEETQTPQDATTPAVEDETHSADAPEQQSSTQTQPAHTTTHRNSFFYLHRPRTATKQIVLIPLSPTMDFTSALRGRTVLEFPTIYVLHESPEALNADSTNSQFLLEEEYAQTHPEPEPEIGETTDEVETQPMPGSKDLTNIDEKKVLEVLKQDLFEPVPAGEAE